MYRRWLWPGFALPGVVWLLILFVVPFYAVVAVAFGTVDPILSSRFPSGTRSSGTSAGCSRSCRLRARASGSGSGVRTIVYVAAALALSLLIGYPVAYYIARHAGRMKSCF